MMEGNHKGLNTKENDDFGLVSIIMPCYNAEKFIKKSIESVINQIYTNWELLIVNDCSSDNSVEIVEQFNDSRIKLIHNEKNSGAAISRNVAIDAAKGRWIAFLDSDDLWDKNKLASHLKFMVSSNSVFSFTPYSVVDSNDVQISVFSPSKKSYGYKDILKHCYIGCSTVIYDAEKIGKRNMPVDATKREDFACWLSILRSGIDAVCFHECLTTYKVHTNSVSSNKLKMVKHQWNVYRKVEKINVIKSVYYLGHWAVKGFLKYR